MLHQFENGVKFWLAVISKNRPLNVKKMQHCVGPASWYVGKGEAKIYRAAGATQVVQGGGLCASRNRAIEDAFREGVPCVQVSDDLRDMGVAKPKVGSEKKTEYQAEKVSFRDVMMMMAGERDEKVFLQGVAPTANPFYFRGERVKERAFIVGDMIVVYPTELRFDERFTLKEDYDYTLQHIERYGAVQRFDDVLFTFAHRTNVGGAVDARSESEELRNIELLKEKWPGKILPSTRGKTEIRLKL